MRSWKDRISNSPPRHGKSFTTTRSGSWRMAIDGNARSPRTSSWTRRTGEGASAHASDSEPRLSPRARGSGKIAAGRRARGPSMLSALFFYLFATILVGAGFMVIAAKNPVHAVLFLILAFFNAAGLFVLLGAEFLAMILVV